MDRKKISIILGIIVIILFSIVLCFVIIRSTEKQLVDQAVLESQKQIKPASAVSNVQSYIDVKELGIKIPVNFESFNDITYTYTTDATDDWLFGEQERHTFLGKVYFYSKSLKSIDKNCPPPYIRKIKGEIPENNFEGAFVDFNSLKQLDGYFLAFSDVTNFCDVSSLGDDMVKFSDALHNGFENLTVIE